MTIGSYVRFRIQFVKISDIVPGNSFLTNEGQIRLVTLVTPLVFGPIEPNRRTRYDVVTYKVTRETEDLGPRSHRLGTVHTLRIAEFVTAARFQVPNTPNGVAEALLGLALSNIIRKYRFGCGSAHCTINPPKGAGSDRDCRCTANWITRELTEAMQIWLTETHHYHAWIGPGSSLVSDKWIPDLSVRLNSDAARYYGAQYFICETITPRAAKTLCAAAGIKLLDAPPAGKTLVQVFAEEELKTITRKRVSNANQNSTT